MRPPDRKRTTRWFRKLRRESHLTLDVVQDLAGVRVDADFSLDVQLALATEVAGHFGERSVIRDIRDEPHSGYRAVHVWLRLPGGRAEIQFRTEPQSAWANAYERLGDLFGREIRYGAIPDRPPAARLVSILHRTSERIARAETATLTSYWS
jgi:ppGpp synthetase/RelA/SpoT-type nucleotidyltranferase